MEKEVALATITHPREAAGERETAEHTLATGHLVAEDTGELGRGDASLVVEAASQSLAGAHAHGDGASLATGGGGGSPSAVLEVRNVSKLEAVVVKVVILVVVGDVNLRGWRGACGLAASGLGWAGGGEGVPFAKEAARSGSAQADGRAGKGGLGRARAVDLGARGGDGDGLGRHARSQRHRRLLLQLVVGGERVCCGGRGERGHGGVTWIVWACFGWEASGGSVELLWCRWWKGRGVVVVVVVVWE